MADFPSNYPALPVLTAKQEHPRSADWNALYREIEAMCTEMGTNPRTITDSTAPAATPASVAAYLDMLATIVKAWVSGSAWTGANVAIRRIFGGGGGNGTVAASTTSYLGVFGHVLNTTEANVRILMAYDGVFKNLYVVTNAAQPASGSMTFKIRISGTTSSSIIVTVAASAAAGTYNATGTVTFKRGDTMVIEVVNNATGVSAQIGCWGAEVNQVG